MHDEVAAFLAGAVPESGARANSPGAGDRSVSVEPGSVPATCRALKGSEWSFEVLEAVSGVDWPDRTEVNYMLASFTKPKGTLILKTSLPKDGPCELGSVSGTWASADWQERECGDMLGVVFRGHPDPRRILCPDDWEGHPLRKDYKPAGEFHGMAIDPPDKVNSADHGFCDELRKGAADPSRVVGSWRLGEDGEGDGAREDGAGEDGHGPAG